MKLGALLLSEKIPFFLSLLLAGVSITVNHLISKYTDMPILEYSKESKVISNGRLITFNVVNLSSEKLFKDFDLEVVLSSKDLTEIDAVGFTFNEPYRSFNPPTSTADKQSVKFSIRYLHPKSVVRLKVRCKSFTAEPQLVFPDDREVDAAMIFLSSSIFTWIIKNEVALNVAFVLLLSTLIIFYIYVISKQPSSSKEINQ